MKGTRELVVGMRVSSMKDIKLRVGQRWVDEFDGCVRAINGLEGEFVKYDLIFKSGTRLSGSTPMNEFLGYISDSKLDKRSIIREFFSE